MNQSEQMRILYITRKYPPSIGGMQRFNEKLTRYLKEISEVHLIAWGGSQLFLPFFIFYAFLQSIFIFLTKKIECIYVSDGLLSPLGYALKKITNKPIYVTVHGTDIAHPLKLYQFFILKALKRIDRVICVSNYLAKICDSKGIKRTTVIPNGVDIDDFICDKNQINKAKEFVRFSLDQKKIILFNGRLIPRKGVESFLKNVFPKIMATNHDVVFLIAGYGKSRKNIIKIIKEKKLENNVFLIGKIPMQGSALKEILNVAHVFVIPNIPIQNSVEGFGIVALEASAAGLPVVASRLDGLKESVADGQTGFLIKHDDYDTFSEKIIELLRNDSYREKFGIKAREYVRVHFSWKDIASRYLLQFESKSFKS